MSNRRGFFSKKKNKRVVKFKMEMLGCDGLVNLNESCRDLLS